MTPRPRWLVATGDFVTTGGMDAANHALASWLLRSGREVELVAHRVSRALADMPGAHVHRVPRPLGSHLLGAPLLSAAAAHQVRKARPRVALANGGNFAGDATWLHYVHAAYEAPIAGRPVRRALQRLAGRLDRRAERAVVAGARVVIANSRLTAEHAVELLGARPEAVQVVYYGADAERFRPASAAERSAARRALSLADDAPALVFVGALGDRRKGFDTLFQAIRRLAGGEGWDATLLVVGAGAELEAWKRRAAEAGLSGVIRFLGFQPDVRPVLFACDAIVAPTRYEAYGLAVQEAICAGLAPLVSRRAGVSERISGALSALLLEDPEDPGELVARLVAWRESVEVHRAAALALSSELRAWSWDDMASRLVDIVERAG